MLGRCFSSESTFFPNVCQGESVVVAIVSSLFNDIGASTLKLAAGFFVRHTRRVKDCWPALARHRSTPPIFSDCRFDEKNRAQEAPRPQWWLSDSLSPSPLNILNQLSFDPPRRCCSLSAPFPLCCLLPRYHVSVDRQQEYVLLTSDARLLETFSPTRPLFLTLLLADQLC